MRSHHECSIATEFQNSGNGAPPFECVALVLQGGGALGAYQAGVYEALGEANINPDWVAGVSIGAINSAIIAGNETQRAGREAAAPFGRRSPPIPCSTGLLPPIPSLQRATSRARSSTSLAQAARSQRVPRGFLNPSAACSLAAPERRPGSHELLRNQTPEEHARAAGRFRPHQCGRDALQCWRCERAHR